MKVNFLKAKKIQELLSKIPENLELYRTGNFGFLMNDPSYHLESRLEIDEHKLVDIRCIDKDDFKEESENCSLIYQALENISLYLARDERLWVYLTHTYLLEYTRARWPIPEDDEQAIKRIKAHFFCIGARGIERDNAASRLWWLASLCHRTKNLSFEDALTSFLYRPDVRDSIVGRPTTSQNIHVFSAIIKKLDESYKSNKELFERERFRSFMKELNLIGGIKLLAALPEVSVAQILEQCIAKAG